MTSSSAVAMGGKKASQAIETGISRQRALFVKTDPREYQFEVSKHSFSCAWNAVLSKYLNVNVEPVSTPTDILTVKFYGDLKGSYFYRCRL